MSRLKSPGAVRLLVCNGALDPDAAAQQAIDRAWNLRFGDPQGMLSWAEVATELAVSTEVRARAQAHLGNAHRVNGNFADARRCLDIAEGLRGETDSLLLGFRASLYENTGALEEAAACLQKAGRLRAGNEGEDGQAKFLTLTGRVLLEAGRSAEATQVFRAALDALESDEDIARTALHGLAHALANSGQPARGLAVLQESEAILENGDVLFRLRVAWLLGRIAVMCDADDFAMANLEEARVGFSKVGLAHETCLVTLDLAVHEARRERFGGALNLLRPIPQLLTKIGVPAHAKTASAVRLLIVGRAKEAVALLEQVITAVES